MKRKTMATKNKGTGDKRYTKANFNAQGKVIHEALKFHTAQGNIPVTVAQDFKRMFANLLLIGNGIADQKIVEHGREIN